MNKPLNEKALRTAAKTVQFKAFKNFDALDLRFAEELAKGAILAYLRATQAGESEAVAEFQEADIDGLHIVGFKSFEAILNLPVGTKLYAAPPSLAALQAENERLRDALKDCRDAMYADNPADGWKEIIENATDTLAGQEKQSS